MDTEMILQLTKARIGISSIARDSYISSIIESIIKELEDEKGILLSDTNANHKMFIVDYATWRYQNRDGDKGMPRNLKFRFNNIMIHNGGVKNGI